MEQLFDFFGTFVDRCHHGKEEELLFPALEQVGISREGGPVGVMLKEHQLGRELVARMKAELSEYKNGDANAARRFKRHADDYIELLKLHIEKEQTSECNMNETDAQGHSNLCCCYIIDENDEYEDPCFQPVEDCCCCG